jgi:hypothetical protein
MKDLYRSPITRWPCRIGELLLARTASGRPARLCQAARHSRLQQAGPASAEPAPRSFGVITSSEAFEKVPKAIYWRPRTVTNKSLFRRMLFELLKDAKKAAATKTKTSSATKGADKSAKDKKAKK